MSKKVLRSGLIAVLLMAVFLSSTYATEIAEEKELKKAKELYNKIEVLYGKKGWGEGYADKMIKECRKLIKKYPHTEYAAKAQYKIAEIQRKCRNYLDALKEYEKAIIDYPKNERVAEAQYYIGELCEHLPDYAWAIEAYEKVISNYPESEYTAKAQFNIGRVHETRCEYNQAFNAYSKIISNYPNSEYVPGARERISACIEWLSISVLDKFIEDNSKSEFIAKAESRILDLIYRAKIEELDKFIKDNPESRYADDAQYRIGQLYHFSPLLSLAIEEYLKVITNYPNSECVPSVRKRISSIISTELSRSQLEGFVKEHPKSEFITEAKKRISYFEKEKEKEEREEAKAREEAERARAQRRKELSSELITYAKKYREVKRKLWSLEYELKYKTPSSEIQEKAQQYKNFCKDEYEPIVKGFAYRVREYYEIYGKTQLRDFAIENDFLDLLE